MVNWIRLGILAGTALCAAQPLMAQAPGTRDMPAGQPAAPTPESR